MTTRAEGSPTSAPRPLNIHVQHQMKLQRTRDTRPELAIRRELHRRGLRYRVDRSPLVGHRFRADMVFGPSRVAVFVDGCFWHGCPDHCVIPKHNRDWWVRKLTANRARDKATDMALREAGWETVRVWEHDDPTIAADLIEELVALRRPGAQGSNRRAIRKT